MFFHVSVSYYIFLCVLRLTKIGVLPYPRSKIVSEYSAGSILRGNGWRSQYALSG